VLKPGLMLDTGIEFNLMGHFVPGPTAVAGITYSIADLYHLAHRK